MKVSFSRSFKGNRGIQKFCASLVKCWQENNTEIQVVDANEKSDIHVIIINGDNKRGAKNIIRVDGVYYDRSRLGLNTPISSSILKADGVIYQSKWAKVFVEGMLGVKAKRNAVVYNAVDQKMYFPAKVPNKYGFDKLFVACSHWRVNKRPEAIAHAFLKARRKTMSNWGLVFVGQGEIQHIKDPAIKYLGTLGVNEIINLYHQADYMCHICHLDACPNSVIEGLSCGLPVITNNIGGTPELVKGDGIVANIDQAFDFKPLTSIDVVSSKSVDIKKLSKAFIGISGRDWKVDRPDLDIAVASKKYYKFFKEVLSE